MAQNTQILAEEDFGDILQGDFWDSFENLTLKQLWFHSWAFSSCKSARAIFQGDDDIFLNVPILRSHVRSQKRKDFVLGRKIENGAVSRTGKYSDQIYPEQTYPTYVSGGAFVLSWSVFEKIFPIEQKLPIIPIDDAFVGVCLKHANLTNHIEDENLFLTGGLASLDFQKFNVSLLSQKIAFHRFSTEDLV